MTAQSPPRSCPPWSPQLLVWPRPLPPQSSPVLSTQRLGQGSYPPVQALICRPVGAPKPKLPLPHLGPPDPLPACKLPTRCPTVCCLALGEEAKEEAFRHHAAKSPGQGLCTGVGGRVSPSQLPPGSLGLGHSVHPADLPASGEVSGVVTGPREG